MLLLKWNSSQELATMKASPSAIDEFIVTIQSDLMLQERLKDSKSVEEVLQIARDSGFELTADDLIAATGEAQIPDESLELIAGGCKVGEAVWSVAVFGICRLWGVAKTCNGKTEGC
jgi:predicted ribosomally synthesized peptide with nif11-like leader